MTTQSELCRLRNLIRQIYPYVVDVPGTEKLQADLEREVLQHLGILSSRSPFHVFRKRPSIARPIGRAKKKTR